MKKLFKFLVASFAFLALLVLPARASATDHVVDSYHLLDESEVEELNDRAREISEQYNFGVYIRIVDNYWNSGTIEQFNNDLYWNENLGYGSDRAAVILTLAMDDRSYDLASYPDTGRGEEVFSDYGRNQIVGYIMGPYMSVGEYYDGFDAYLDYCEDYLKAAADGNPISEYNDPIAEEARRAEEEAEQMASNAMKGGASVGVPFITSLLICLGLRSKNKTEGIKTEAGDYIEQGGVHLTHRADIFLHRSVTRTKIHRESSRSGGGGGGFTSHSGGGGHTSGHF